MNGDEFTSDMHVGIAFRDGGNDRFARGLQCYGGWWARAMNLSFREIQPGDIPRIVEISKDNWEGHDYMPKVIRHWVERSDYFTYGAFRETDGLLVAMASVRWFSGDIAWIEGGRVDPGLQGRGIGRELTRYGLEYIRKHGGQVAQFDAASDNAGSNAIAREFGFHEVIRTRVLVLERNEITFTGESSDADREVDARSVFTMLNALPEPPRAGLCTGWAYVPFTLEHVRALPWKWMVRDGLIALVMNSITGAAFERPDRENAWFVLHGDPRPARGFLQSIISKIAENDVVKNFSVFCTDAITPSCEDLGFHGWRDNDLPIWTCLFEKHF
ncbi:MAG: GNAT family N-acetyltransferase [Promethearchaeota archaeon]